MGHFAGSNIEIFEIKGGEDSQQVKSLNFMQGMLMVIVQSRGMMDRIGAVKNTGAPELDTEKELCGLEMPELTQRSRELTWGIHGCQAPSRS
jgi:hypothetical protein